MEFVKISNEKIIELYEAFKDNDGFMVSEGEKYTEATKRILDLDNIDNADTLRNLRNSFVYTVSDLMTAVRTLMQVSEPMKKMYNVYSNMLQYVTVEIDIRISECGGNV